LLKPACPGTGIIAGGAVRAVMDAAGLTDVISKSQGSRTSVNVVRATFDAVNNLMDARSVAQNRGKTLKDLWG
jgi:small subunit ribosomal protein S5